MHHSRPVSAPSLELIFETIHGFQRTGALKAAVELDVFTGIANGANTALTLARRTEASERGMRILCDYLTVLGLLTKTANRYELTPDSHTFLNKNSPAYVGTAIEFLLSPPQVEPFQDVASAVRNGGAVTGQGVVAPEYPVWVTFARAMAPLMALLVNFLHHFDPPTVEVLLRKVYQALGGSDRVAILEFIPNEDRISPRVPAAFSMMMLPTTPHDDAYTFSEYARILRHVGFSASEPQELQPTYFRVVLARK